MTDLSPAAQQVFWEFNRAASGKPDDWHYLPAIAAALRAAADQVVPQPPMLVEGGRTYEESWTATVHEHVRHQLLAIAVELETSTTENR
jgi:hypothetical protein